MRHAIAVAAVLTGATLLATAPAAAQQPEVELTAQQATEALAVAEATLAPEGPPAEAEAAPDASAVLNVLAAGMPELDRFERRRARALLARPTDGQADQFGDGYPAGAPVASAESPHFCVHWINSAGFQDAPALTDGDGDGTPDYVEAIIAIAEYSYSVEVAPGVLGWAPPKPDTGGCSAAPAAHADVYLKQLAPAGLFGYESPDPGQGRARSKYGYMVIDDDYATAEYGYPDPLDPAKVTFAHEFNHLLQQNYDSFQDVWMFESTAVWAEEFVYPAINDYLSYLPSFAASPGAPITDAGAAKGLKIYGSGVWNHWLSGPGGGHGVETVRRAWEVSELANPADLATASYDRAIRGAGGRGFSREFVGFSGATAEWRTGLGGFPDAALYPEMRRKGSLNKGRRKKFELDHTASRLLNVNAGGRGKVRLRVRVEDGVRAGLALVARDGAPLSGSVTRKTEYLDRGGRGSVTLGAPGRFERITAVIVNADGRVRGFEGTDWLYRKDKAHFRAWLTGG